MRLMKATATTTRHLSSSVLSFSSALLFAGRSLPSPARSFRRIRQLQMRKNGGGDGGGLHSAKSSVHSNPKVNRMQQQLVDADPSDGWEKCWEQGLTPWDLGQPTPIILHLNQTGSLPKGRALVPGCGSGYDVVAMANPERYVVGLDISEMAIKKAKELSSTSQHINHFTFFKADFFSWHPSDSFDLIFDYTFFCAIEQALRPAWARKMKDLLKPDGELITLMFPISDHVGGPPYKVSVADYEEILHPLGFKSTILMDNDLAVGPRRGREKLARWRMMPSRSFL